MVKKALITEKILSKKIFAEKEIVILFQDHNNFAEGISKIGLSFLTIA